ncbi:long-chain-acyl-CoA dehydrogenase [Actinocorallia herbida]|uniref:Long-chain-acyl-CoA dehydrogenase n=1 Tax=Actinocorallia herbida TaxID=58109 RepID=A0A3N1D234_9ACTN|nr:acyl-CoA dehydrogenase family protein [Actinocorallia herbida]ROO87593.1 long-chain-acyl-CoA dehydrogenase [Actinocorallia herbida]
MERDLFDREHEEFRAVVRDFVAREVVPNLDAWEVAGAVDRSLFRRAGSAGLLGLELEEGHGGGGTDDLRFSVVVNEELSRVGASSVVMNICGFNDLIAPYLAALCTEQQKEQWLPGLCSGERIGAIAMTEPGTGSDLKAITTTARREGDHYVLNGAKTFISNGTLADLVIVVVKTDPGAGSRGVSLLVVESNMPGFQRGRKLDKIGLLAQDTAELFFDDVRVPAANLLGREGEGFGHLRSHLVRERLSVTVTAAASMEATLAETIDYVHQRTAFGQRVADFQATRFTLAELATEVQIARTFLDRCVAGAVRRELTEVDAAMAKWWITELQQRVVGRCLQLHGGYGYMREYPVARAYLDARVGTLYAGTTEIMKEIIGRSLTRPSHPD